MCLCEPFACCLGRAVSAWRMRKHTHSLVLARSQVPNDTPLVPVFAFTTRKGNYHQHNMQQEPAWPVLFPHGSTPAHPPARLLRTQYLLMLSCHTRTHTGANYPADQAALPTVRQLPHQHTACLDDKRQLQQHLQAAGVAHQLLPRSWDSLADYSAWLQEQQPKQQPSNAEPSSPPIPVQVDTPSTPSTTSTANSEDSNRNDVPFLPHSIFVKHRLGVKGQAVYVLHTTHELLQLQQRLGGSAADFVVQEEVASPMLLKGGRKFVLRVHVLMVLRQPGVGSGVSGVPQLGSKGAPAAVVAEDRQPQVSQGTPLHGVAQHPPFDVYVHDDVIVLPHAAAYEPGSSTPAVHISSKGAGHPTPFLLHQRMPELHGTVVWPQLQQLAARTLSAVAQALVPPVVSEDCAVLYHLFGLDCVVEDASGRVVLLEVNSYPAIASGTMSAVASVVYTRLLEDLVRLIVLPVADGVPAQAGGFVRCVVGCGGN